MENILPEYELAKFQKKHNYMHKLKNRTHGYVSHRRPHQYIGNSLSSSHSRPSGHTDCSGRLDNKKYNIIVSQQMASDIKLTNNYSDRKSINQHVVPYYERINKNEQIHDKTEQKHTENEIRFVHLDNIHTGLYIGNIEAGYDIETLCALNIKYIIDVSGNFDKYQTQSKIKIKTIKYNYNDTRSLSYSNFKRIMDEIIPHMTDKLELQNVLIICEKGVNRAPSIAIAYAIIVKKMTFNGACTYVDDVKLEKHPYWNNLTNYRIRNLLKSLS